MVIADPSAELLGLVRAMGDPASDEAPPAAQRAAHLLRRRFGLALPPPFVGPPSPTEAVRPARVVDGAAIAAIKWRTFGTSYRGLLPDDFLDARGVVPPATYWTGRAMVPPSRHHRLLVWGRPGTVFGYLDAGPAHPDGSGGGPDDDQDGLDEPEGPDGMHGPDGDLGALADDLGQGARRQEPTAEVGEVGEIYELYVDPCAQGHGGGAQLLEEAVTWLSAVGFDRLELSTLTANGAAQGFYEGHGWSATGRVDHVDLGVVTFDESRYARRRSGDAS